MENPWTTVCVHISECEKIAIKVEEITEEDGNIYYIINFGSTATLFMNHEQLKTINLQSSQLLSKEKQ